MTTTRLVLTNARLIDAVTPGVVAGASVTIEGDRIVEVLDGRRSPATPGAQIVDLRGGYLLPGLWDAHVHLEWPRVPQAGVPELTAQYLANAQRALIEAGVTGLRMAGTSHFIDVALKRAFDSGQNVGPRLFTCGWFLTTTAWRPTPSARAEDAVEGAPGGESHELAPRGRQVRDGARLGRSPGPRRALLELGSRPAPPRGRRSRPRPGTRRRYAARAMTWAPSRRASSPTSSSCGRTRSTTSTTCECWTWSSRAGVSSPTTAAATAANRGG